jgi:hypothetical protein
MIAQQFHLNLHDIKKLSNPEESQYQEWLQQPEKERKNI